MSLSIDILSSVVAAISESVIITDANLEKSGGPRILYVNRAFEEMTGYSLKEIGQKSLRILQGPRTDPDILDHIRDSLKTAKIFRATITNYKKDGTPFELEWKIEQLSDTSGAPLYYLAVQRDVTKEKEVRRRSKQLHQLWQVTRKIAAEELNLDLIRQRVTEAAMEMTDAEAAVIEEPEGSEMVYRSVAGTAEGSTGLRLPMDKSISGLCYRSEETLICEDAQMDFRVRLKQKAMEIGFRSAVIVPLLHRNRCLGVLKVYSRQPGNFTIFDKQMLELGTHILASYLFNAAAFDEEIRKRQLLLDAVPIYIAFVDSGKRYTEINAVHEELFARPLSEIRGKPLASILQKDNYDRIHPYLDGALAGNRISFEVNLYNVQGEERTFSGNLEPHYGENGCVDGCYAAFQDITDVKLSETDYLTGLLNRRKFQEMAGFALKTLDRSETPVTLLMLDIDHFKKVNDTHGHFTGDEVLKQFGNFIRRSVRKSDLTCRWGGEEFMILLFGSDVENAKEFANRLLKEIRVHSFGRAGFITASIGIAGAIPNETLESLQERADTALYRAKAQGRDRLEL